MKDHRKTIGSEISKKKVQVGSENSKKMGGVLPIRRRGTIIKQIVCDMCRQFHQHIVKKILRPPSPVSQSK